MGPEAEGRRHRPKAVKTERRRSPPRAPPRGRTERDPVARRLCTGSITLVRVLAQELGRDGVRVNAISPGMTRTGMTARVYADPCVAAQRDALGPLGRVATREDMAAAIAFLLGPDARYVNGHDLVVDGGVTGNLLGRLPSLSQITRT